MTLNSVAIAIVSAPSAADIGLSGMPVGPEHQRGPAGREHDRHQRHQGARERAVDGEQRPGRPRAARPGSASSGWLERSVAAAAAITGRPASCTSTPGGGPPGAPGAPISPRTRSISACWSSSDWARMPKREQRRVPEQPGLRVDRRDLLAGRRRAASPASRGCRARRQLAAAADEEVRERRPGADFGLEAARVVARRSRSRAAPAA